MLSPSTMLRDCQEPHLYCLAMNRCICFKECDTVNCITAERFACALQWPGVDDLSFARQLFSALFQRKTVSQPSSAE